MNFFTIFGLVILIISIIIGTIRLLNIINLLESNNIHNNSNNKIDEKKGEYYDLIIVGAGLSGLTAAYESYKIANDSINILILETSSHYGGNIKNEIDGINLLLPERFYKDENGEYIEDNFSSYYDDAFEFGRYLSEKDLLTVLVNNSYDLYNFLFKDLDCSNLRLIQSEGSKVPRTLIYNNSELTTGKYLTSMIYNKIKNISSINILFNSHFIDLIVTEDYKQIKGAIYEIQEGEEIINVTAYCKSLILASGGYGSDFYDTKESILKEFLIQFYNLPTFSNFYTQGNGIKIARNKGAVLIDQRQAEIYPTCFVDLLDRFNRHKILAPDRFRKLGGILMNKRGKRFCNEIGNRRYVAQNLLKNCDIVTDPKIIKQYEGFLIINEEIKEQYGEEIEDYISKGYLKKYKSFDDFSKQMNISEYYTNIRKSVISYNQGYDKSRDKYGKEIFPCKFTMGETIYVGIVTPCIYHTLGGVRINENAQVLNEEKRPIKGLFASGEVAGGIHGAMAMQGNILTEAVVFGRVAAKSAVDFIMK